MELSTILGK